MTSTPVKFEDGTTLTERIEKWVYVYTQSLEENYSKKYPNSPDPVKFEMESGRKYWKVNQIGGAILATNVALLVDMGAASGDRMAAYMDAPLIVGGSIQTLFVLFILAFQLAMVWTKD